MTKAFVGLSILLLCLSSSLAHNCIHDHIEHKFNIHPEEDDVITKSRRNLAGTPNWQPIRIHADYSSLRTSNPAHSNFIQYKLMPAAIKYLQSVLSVEPLSVLRLQSPDCHKVMVSSQYTRTGVSGVDLVIFVTAETEKDPNTMAWATYCQLGSDRRPIAGRINFNPAHLLTDEASWVSQYSTAVHELTHVLAFSRSLYPHWRTWNGGSPIGEITVRGKRTTIVTTPRVAQLSKRYFGCSSLQGAEIEDDGGAGSAGSHWERRIFGNEMLTASDVPDPRFSSFTLALLEDSGWYKTDYSKADTLEFGRDTGCSFHFDECINRATKKSRFPEFCDSPNQDMCTFDHTSKGKCLAGYGNYITYDYMGDGTQGTDPYADECFTVTPYTNNGDCRKTGTSSPYQPEVYGPNSRCFAGTLMNPRYSLSGAKSISGCYTHQCQVQGGMTRLIIQVGGTSITCPLGGGPTQAIKGSYEGYLICPHEKYVCKSAPINPNFIAL